MQNKMIDVTTFNSTQREFIEVPEYGPVEIYRNAPFSITTTAIPLQKVVYEEEISVEAEPLGTLPWDAPAPPTPPRGFENLPTAEMFQE
jgi:hypothetical protein